MCLCVHWCMCMWYLPWESHPCPLRHGLSLSWSTIRLDWLGSGPWGSSCICLTNVETASVHHYVQFWMGSEGQNSEPYAFEANTYQMSYGHRPLLSCFYSCFFRDLFLLFYLCVFVCMSTNVCHVHAFAGIRAPRNWSSRQLWAYWHGYWEWNFGPLEE